MHDFLSKLHQWSGTSGRFSLILLIPYLAIILVLLLPPLLKSRSSDTVADLISVTMSEDPSGPWQPVDLSKLVLPNDHAWLKAVFSVPGASLKEGAPPLGLFLSGTFSASTVWNGVEVGAKGVAGRSRDQEQPGPIDEVIFLPKDVLVIGNNTALLEMSSHYRMENINTIIHGTEEIFGFRLGPYSAENRRPINYYIVPLLTSILLIIAIAAIVVRGEILRLDHLTALLLIATLLIAASAELFRAFFAYPYQYHPFRILTVSFAVATFFSVLPFYVLERSGAVQSWKIRAIGFLLLWAGCYFLSGGGSFVFSLVVLIAIAVNFFVKDKDSASNRSMDLPLIIALFTLFVFSLFNYDLFLDRFLYAAIIPLIVCIVWLSKNKRMSVLDQSEHTLIIERLVIKSAGKQQLIEFEDIVSIAGAGNYSEVNLNNGTKLLDDRSLKDLSGELPDNFFRIHRSTIVNLNFISCLQSKGGGKYIAELKDGAHFPVSRANIQQLRQTLDQAQSDNAPSMS